MAPTSGKYDGWMSLVLLVDKGLGICRVPSTMFNCPLAAYCASSRQWRVDRRGPASFGVVRTWEPIPGSRVPSTDPVRRTNVGTGLVKGTWWVGFGNSPGFQRWPLLWPVVLGLTAGSGMGWITPVVPWYDSSGLVDLVQRVTDFGNLGFSSAVLWLTGQNHTRTHVRVLNTPILLNHDIYSY